MITSELLAMPEFHQCIGRIRAKFARRGKIDLWDDATFQEFVTAFRLIPPGLWCALTDELLLHPPANDAGFVNYLPDPADLITLARRVTEEGQPDATTIAGEIWEAVRRVGYYGTPRLSPLAAQVIANFGGWEAFCSMESPDGVTQGLLLKHAQAAVLRSERQALFGRNEAARGLFSAAAKKLRLEVWDEGVESKP